VSKLVIFGAGMAGLIAARMLADRSPVIHEQQPALPNNHHALLRFRSSAVGDATNIPFERVSVVKHVLSDSNSNPIRDAIIYSKKVTGKIHARPILDTKPVERYVAPQDMIQRLAVTADIKYDSGFLEWSHEMVRDKRPSVISTIPVNKMMELFNWPNKPNFVSSPGWTIKAGAAPALDCKVNATVYSAQEHTLWYRASITGDKLTIEGSGSLPDGPDQGLVVDQVCEAFGLDRADLSRELLAHQQKYQKIADLGHADRESVKRFVIWLSSEHRIYSLGRFATWRPKLLLDDLVNDVRVIAKLIGGESNYNAIIGKE
jgi:hypothetical protein